MSITDAGAASAARRTLLPILAILFVLGFTNLFLRSSFGVMSPVLAREMALSPQLLSTIAASFFFAYAAMQIPTGMLLDRFGARRTIATMLLFTMLGTALFALGQSALTLSVGRVMMGIGCAGVFTGAFYVLALWLPPDRVVVQIGALNSFAGFGNLCATAPLAALIAAIGWRESYWIFTAAVAVILIGVAVVVRDRPPGAKPSPTRDESLREILAGVRDAVRQPGMKRLLIVGLPMSAASTISGAWGAPYLKDVHGLDDIGRGTVLLVMAVFSMSGHYTYGWLARRLNTLKLPILTGSGIILAILLLLALVPHPPLWLVMVLFAVLGIVSAYPTITHAHARGLVPARLMGRGVSVTNTGVMTAIATMQFAFGWILGAFPAVAGVPPEIAYRAGFGVQALMALIGILVYVPIPDVKPRG